MSLILDSDIFNWLISLGLVKSSNAIKLNSNNKCELDENITQQFGTGLIFSKIVEKIIKLQPSNKQDSHMLSKIDSLKNATTPASKLYNWNLICEALKKLNIIIDQDVKSLIVAGDLDLINEVLREIYNAHSNIVSVTVNSANGDVIKFIYYFQFNVSLFR